MTPKVKSYIETEIVFRERQLRQWNAMPTEKQDLEKIDWIENKIYQLKLEIKVISECCNVLVNDNEGSANFGRCTNCGEGC